MSINDIFPSELLLEVFGHAVHDPSVERFWRDPIHPPLRTMLAITHVCKQWRSVGLENSTLWMGCVDMGRPHECVKEILRRSGTQPLNLTFFIAPLPMRNSIARPHYGLHRPPRNIIDTDYRGDILSRTRSLEATLPAIGYDQIFDCFREHLWQMEAISLKSDFWSAVLGDYGLFDGPKWMARTLSLKHCTFNLQPKALPFLEELRIKSPSPEAFPYLETWLSLLAGLPQLRVLELVNFSSPIDIEPFRAAEDPKVHLPKLETLIMTTSEENPSILAPLLGALVIPPSCALNLRVIVEKYSPSSTALFSVLSDRYSAYHNALGDHLDLTISFNAFTIQTRGPSTPAETRIDFEFSGGCRHFGFNSDNSITQCSNLDCTLSNAGLIFQTVLEALRKPLKAIRWLSLKTMVQGDTEINPFFNLPLLRKFPHLEFIDLNVETIFGGFPFMDWAAPPMGPKPSDVRMFWSLTKRELIISKVDFTLGTPLHKLGLALVQHLKPQRKRWNPEWCIQRLSLRRCTGLRNSHLKKLEALVGTKYGVNIVCVECVVKDDHY